MTQKNKIIFSVILLFMIIFLGTLGYRFIEGWNLLESFYATIVTLTTVGYGDFYPHTQNGRIFTIILVVFGVGAMLYTIVLVAESFVEGQLKTFMGRDKLKKMIDKMNNHYIICGCGRIGYLIGKELKADNVDFVVIENDPEIMQKIEDAGFVYYQGDATQDNTLISAGIKRAKGIVCVLPTDAQNIYVILTAKELNPNLYILSRAEEEESEHRLVRAGADRVMSPYTQGGVRMAMAILRPAMLDFIEISTRRQSLELRMEEIEVCQKSQIIGKSLEESAIRNKYGLIIIAVKKKSAKMIFNPPANYMIEEGDNLIAMGEEDNIQNFTKVCVE
ncbi:MAG: potassium channel protein [Deltaproteobacteria bacterium]|nr:potassium channel protein [Deltaproteobacteria bacterium]